VKCYYCGRVVNTTLVWYKDRAWHKACLDRYEREALGERDV